MNFSPYWHMTTSTATESKVIVQLVAFPCLHYFYSLSVLFREYLFLFFEDRVDSGNKEVECSKKVEIKIDFKIKMYQYLYMDEVS